MNSEMTDTSAAMRTSLLIALQMKVVFMSLTERMFLITVLEEFPAASRCLDYWLSVLFAVMMGIFCIFPMITEKTGKWRCLIYPSEICILEPLI